jgi:thiol-disulfide isomerase/thioredoxin
VVKILFFSSASCKYCPAIEKHTQEMAIRYGYPVEVIKREDDIEPFEKYNVTGLPTVMLLHNDKPMWQATGTVERSKIDREFSKWSY